MSEAAPFHIDLVSIENIAIVNAAINNKAGIGSLQTGVHSFDIQYAIDSAVNLSAKKVRIIFSCTIKAFKGENEPVDIDGNFQIAYYFHIDNLNELTVEVGEGELNMDQALAGSLFNIAYSTSRGIIYSRCLGTILGNIILPVMATDKLLKGAAVPEGRPKK